MSYDYYLDASRVLRLVEFDKPFLPVNWSVVNTPIQDKVICASVWFVIFVLPYIFILSK